MKKMNEYQRAWDKILNRRETLFGNSNTVRDILVNLPTQESLILEVNMIKELVDKAPYYEELENRATPKKVKNKRPFLGSDRDKLGNCPVCGMTVHEDSKFCNQCGNSLDWSEDE